MLHAEMSNLRKGEGERKNESVNSWNAKGVAQKSRVGELTPEKEEKGVATCLE